MSILAVFNQKGGVGKTTTSFNLSAAMRRDNVHPLLLDLDPQCHLTMLAGVQTQLGTSLYGFYKEGRQLTDLIRQLPNGFNLIPSHIELCKMDMLLGREPRIATKLRNAIRSEMLETPDMPIVFDCCPMLGVLSINALVAAERVLVPVAADYLSYQGAVQLSHTLTGLEHALKRKFKRRYLITRFDKDRKTSQEIVDKLRDTFGDDVCDTVISESAPLAEALLLGKDVFQYDAAKAAADEYTKLFEELVGCGFLPIGD
ncbi:ParA family protein [Leeia sp. TBRC 13508]|uniref:ParA family protein n=1 Tax=Leeia speluncae TaxID=2884804 RepID=A0ABS8D2L0_9NEIS|nr:ParA family protein [Leeia speluncae]MCB6182430.1 ParA family protein [Leeia speluncae]